MTRRPGWGLRLAVLAAVSGAFVLPILAGVWETGRAAFGLLPAVGGESLSLEPWRQLFGLPGVERSLMLSLWTGAAATLLSLVFAFSVAAVVQNRLCHSRIARAILPILAAPHAAVAVGLAFLVAPSGWIVRILSPWATGWARPPELVTLNDPYGLTLILGLVLKETPFLLLVTLSALSQLPGGATLKAARSLGYATATGWLLVLAPQVYRLIRLPVLVVLSFGLSVVDMAMILGPTNPPTFAVALTRWYLSADTGMILPASAAALTQVALVVVAGVIWIAGERLVARLGRRALWRGCRGAGLAGAARGFAAGAALLAGLAAGSLLALLLWSLTWRWSFPNALPERMSLGQWTDPGSGWGAALLETAGIGLASTLISLVLSIAWLEGEDRGGLGRAPWAEALLYLPLLLPQIAFLYGLSVALLRVGVGGGRGAVILGHLLFVLPYMMIALSGPWRRLDRRHVQSAAALGAGPWRRLFRVKLPILLRPILTAFAIGFGVSVAQYLPTLFLGAGRIVTLTTEAVALSSGADRRIAGTYAALQSLLPLAVYGIAVGLPELFRPGRAIRR